LNASEQGDERLGQLRGTLFALLGVIGATAVVGYTKIVVAQQTPSPQQHEEAKKVTAHPRSGAMSRDNPRVHRPA
jgi:hypothetical protein